MTASGETTRSAWSLHGVCVEMASAEPDIAAAAARLMAPWPRAARRAGDLQFELSRANGARLSEERLPTARTDHWPGLECGADGHILWFRREQCGSLVVTDLRAGRGRAYLAAGHAGERAVERALNGLLLMALVQLLARRQLFSIHACAAADEGRAVLAAAERGAGKSTLAVSLARAGLSVLSDDRILIRRAGRGIQCLAWPGPVNLTEESVGLFPELASAPLPRSAFHGKVAVPAAEVYRSPAIDSAPPRLLLFPTVGAEAESSFVPLAPGEALARLVPCSLFYAHRQVLAEHLAVLRDLVATSRCHHLRLGRDVADVGKRIADLLASS